MLNGTKENKHCRGNLARVDTSNCSVSSPTCIKDTCPVKYNLRRNEKGGVRGTSVGKIQTYNVILTGIATCSVAPAGDRGTSSFCKIQIADTMAGKAAVLLLCALAVGFAQGQNYCDASYNLVDNSCCTILTVIDTLGGCCFTPEGACKCQPGTCGTTYTQAPPSTTAPAPDQSGPRLCPTPPSPTSRLLNSPLVTDVCDHNGVIGLFGVINGVKRQFCNAVVVFNSYTNTREIVMSDECRLGITALMQQNLQILAQSQNVEFPFSMCNIAYEFSNADRSVMIPDLVLAGFLSNLVHSCDNTACGFNAAVMGSEVRPETECYLLSYGATGIDITSPGDYVSSGLRRARVTTAAYQQCGLTTLRSDELCVRLEDGAGACQGDTSAFLQCPLTTGEYVFMGFVSTTTACDGVFPSYLPVKLYVLSATSQG